MNTPVRWVPMHDQKTEELLGSCLVAGNGTVLGMAKFMAHNQRGGSYVSINNGQFRFLLHKSMEEAMRHVAAQFGVN